jgi:DNA repair exonuclease SbcCD ATPase subunit
MYPISDQWVKNHPHKLILIKQIVNHPVTYRISETNVNKIINLEDFNKELYEKNTQLEDKIKILEDNNKQYEDKINKLEKNVILIDEIKQYKKRIKELENENKTINELYKNLVDKCLINNKVTKNNNCNNITTNNTNNTININLVPFGMENLDDFRRKKSIVNAGLYCSVICAKKLNCNHRLPQYHNISFTNLRSSDAKIFDKDNTWKTIDKEDLFETIIPRRIDDVNTLIDNEDIKVSPYINNLLEKGTDEDKVLNDTKIKKKFHRAVYDFNKDKERKKKIK